MEKVTDEEIRAWADGELSADRRVAIELLIATEQGIAAKAAYFEASKLPYKTAMDYGLPAVPTELKDQVTQWSKIATGSPVVSKTSNKNSFRYWSSVAVFLLIAWGGVSLLKPSHPTEAWVSAVVSYQNFYVAETVSHIVGDPAAATIKLNGLKQLYPTFPSSLPDLSSQGYAYKRLQRLGFTNQPVLQMVFYKAGKRPLAICLMPDSLDITAQFTQHELLNSYIWKTGSLRAIVVAEEESDVLKSIAKLIGT